MPESKEVITITESGIRNMESGNQEKLITDLQERPGKVPEKIKSWLEKVEEEQIVSDVNDSQGKPILQSTGPTTPKTKLPTTKRSFMNGFKMTVDEAGRWLSVFVLRLIKIKKGKANFLEE